MLKSIGLTKFHEIFQKIIHLSDFQNRKIASVLALFDVFGERNSSKKFLNF